MMFHHQNLTDGELPLWRHGRAWLGSLGVEWCVFRRVSCGIAIGARSFSIRLPGLSLYAHVGDSNPFERREFEVAAHGGCVWISHPWVRPMEWRSDDPWWKKQITLHVVEWLIGKTRHSETKGDPIRVLVPMPEGSYVAWATPSTATWKRRWYWPRKTRKSVWLEIPGGIPHSGKGENSWDCGDDALCGTGGATVPDAIGNAVANALNYRARYGLDSKNTGREPAKVCNEEFK